jgi:hypothetical protein
MLSSDSAKIQRALDHLRQLEQDLADRPYIEGEHIPSKNFDLVAELFTGIGSALILIGEPAISPGPGGELLVDWEPPKPEIHVVVARGKMHCYAYTSNGDLYADNLAEVTKLVLRVAGAVPADPLSQV